MSTVSTSQVPKPGPDLPDPFRYGWRYVRVQGPDGTESFDQVPLTLEDVLHPETGDFIVQSDPHDDDLNYLKDVFKSRLADDPRAAVVSDCRVDWNLPGIRPLGPDIAVFVDVKQHRPWVTLDVAAEGANPAMVVEVTSPDTRANDLEVKVDYYHRARVPLYVIADALQDDGEERHLRLIGYRHTRAGSRKIAPDARGWLWLGPVLLWLGVTRDRRLGYDRVACFDPESGEEIGDYTAVSKALTAEKEARAQAEHRAEEALTAEKEARAQAEHRAVAEAARADIEAEARAQAEARIRELEAALRRPGQGS
jgi:colicin import membrane protein